MGAVMRISSLLRLTGPLLSSLLGLGGCGGSTDHGGTTAAPVAREDFSQKLAEALCNNVGACCASAGYAYDAAGCTAALKSVYDQQLANPNASYDANKGGACVAYAAQIAKACKDADPGPCDAVFTGTLPPGSACTSSSECAPPANGIVFCDQNQCVQEPRGTLGSPCNETCTEHGTAVSCSGSSSGSQGTCYTNDGFFCGASHTCEKLTSLGQPCSYEGCVSGAYCDTSSGVCTAAKGIGQPCQDYDQCVASAWCDVDAGTCAATKADGAACSSSAECANGHCSTNRCGGGFVDASMCSGA
jgi:hypothetical protein